MNNLDSVLESCSVCGSSNFPFFIKVGHKMICIDCRPSKQYKKEINIEDKKLFTKYICTVHRCETYDVQQMYGNHYMDNRCNIIEKVTKGIERPATKGGLNGDINRKHFYMPTDLHQLQMIYDNYVRYKNIQRDLILIRKAKRYAQRGEVTPEVSKEDMVFYYNHEYFRDGLNVEVDTNNSKLILLSEQLMKYAESTRTFVERKEFYKKEKAEKYKGLQSVLDELDND